MIICNSCKEVINDNTEEYYELIRHGGLSEPGYSRTITLHFCKKCYKDAGKGND